MYLINSAPEFTKLKKKKLYKKHSRNSYIKWFFIPFIDKLPEQPQN